MEGAVLTAIECAWLGGLPTESEPQGELGRLLTLEEVGEVFRG